MMVVEAWLPDSLGCREPNGWSMDGSPATCLIGMPTHVGPAASNVTRLGLCWTAQESLAPGSSALLG